MNAVDKRTKKVWSEKMESISLESQAQLTKQEKHLIQMIREMKYGELHIFISESKPIRVEEIKKSIKL